VKKIKKASHLNKEKNIFKIVEVPGLSVFGG
jgi:hypothetical protein